MPSAKTTITVNVNGLEKMDDHLKRITKDLQEEYLGRAVKNAGNVVAREASRLAPKPGYPGDKAGKPALSKSIKVKKWSAGTVVMAIVGGTWPDGAHAHLVEFGHRMFLPSKTWKKAVDTGGFVKGKPFMRPAADTTIERQKKAIIDTLKRAVKKLG